MSVALRMALNRDPDVALGTIATAGTALVVALVAATAETPARGVHLSSAWPFMLAGLLTPGAAQILITIAIRDAGASRVSMVFGTAPLVSVTIALLFLNEPDSRIAIVTKICAAPGESSPASTKGQADDRCSPRDGVSTAAATSATTSAVAAVAIVASAASGSR